MPRPRRHTARPVPAVIGPVQAAEPRVMLSGNVDVSFGEDGQLTVQADQEANDLDIEFHTDGDIAFSSDAGTTVNGQAAGDVTVDIPEGGIQGITVILGGGEDRITIGGEDGGRQSVVGDVLIRAGGGNDDVTLSNLSVVGRVRVVGGPADDVLSVFNVNADDFSLEGGRDDDVIAVEDARGTDTLLVYGGRGEDTIIARDVSVASTEDTPRLYGGFDDDTLAVEDDPSTLLAKGNAGEGSVLVEDGLDADGEEDSDERAALDEAFAAAGGRAGRDLLGVPRQTDGGANAATILSDGVTATSFSSDATVETDDSEGDVPETDPVDEAEGTDVDADALFPAVDTTQFLTTDSGLRYRIIEPGVGAGAADGDNVRLNYRLFLEDGSPVPGNDTFASGSPTSFSTSRVIDGFSEALSLIGEDGAIQVLVPPELGYGAAGQGVNIPGNATLQFDIQTLSITRS